jgi:hypothetical protein
LSATVAHPSVQTLRHTVAAAGTGTSVLGYGEGRRGRAAVLQDSGTAAIEQPARWAKVCWTEASSGRVPVR